MARDYIVSICSCTTGKLCTGNKSIEHWSVSLMKCLERGSPI